MFSLSTKNTRKNGMERTHLQVACLFQTHQSAYTLFHLAGSLIGEGQCQNIPRLICMTRQQIGDFVGQHTRLT